MFMLTSLGLGAVPWIRLTSNEVFRVVVPLMGETVVRAIASQQEDLPPSQGLESQLWL